MHVSQAFYRQGLRIPILMGIGSSFVAGVLLLAPVMRAELHSLEPKHASLLLTPAEWQPTSFRTEDNLRLSAWYSPTQNGATIVLLHGYAGNREQLLPVAELLRKQGFGVLSYDTRAHGESEGEQVGYGETEVLDLKAALDWLEARHEVDISRIGGYGFSLGGFILARAAAKDRRIASVVLSSAPSSILKLTVDEGGKLSSLLAHVRMITLEMAGVEVYAPSTLDAVKAISPRPLLILAGGKDTVVPPERAQEIFEAAGSPKTLAVFPEVAHGDYTGVDVERFQRLVVNHYKRTLNKHDQDPSKY